MGSSPKSSMAAFAPTITAESARQQSLLDLMQKTPPQKPTYDLGMFDKLIHDYAMLNSYKSKAAERELDPSLAGAREGYEKDLITDYNNSREGNLSPAVHNALVKAGLQGAASGGFGKGSRGTATAQAIFGRGTQDYLNQMRSLMSQYLQMKGSPVVGIDPGTAAGLKQQEMSEGVGIENAFRQNLLNNTFNAANNSSNLGMGLLQSAAQQGAANRAGSGNKFGKIAGGAMSGASMGAMAGPYGALGGAALGGMMGAFS